MVMVLRSFALAAIVAGLAVAGPSVDARPRDKEQDAAFKATQQGRIMPLRTIESRIVPSMRGADYLGPELDAGSSRYRLKFLRDGKVIWVDVDARTGDILGRSGD
jgi:uncharacterized membrane protein YkoI